MIVVCIIDLNNVGRCIGVVLNYSLTCFGRVTDITSFLWMTNPYYYEFRTIKLTTIETIMTFLVTNYTPFVHSREFKMFPGPNVVSIHLGCLASNVLCMSLDGIVVVPIQCEKSLFLGLL